MKKFPRYLLVSFIIATIFFILDESKDITLCIGTGCLFGLISLFFDTKEGKKQKKEAIKRYNEEKEREEQARKAAEAARNAPGCYCRGNVDLLTFGSRNNLLTVGNNEVRFKIRNRNTYDVLVDIRLKYSDGWDSYVKTYEVKGNSIRTVETLGRAWRKAIDVSIEQVH